MEPIVERLQSNEYVLLFTIFLSNIAGILTYLKIPIEPFSLLALLIVIDFITGIWKAHSLGLQITSHKAKYGIVSKFSLLFIPIVMAIGARAIGQDGGEFFTYGLNLLIVSEMYSAISNIYCLRTKQELPEWDAISLIGKKIRNMFGGDKNDMD